MSPGGECRALKLRWEFKWRLTMKFDEVDLIDHESEVDGCDVKVIHITADEDLPPSEGGVR
jgi:hypothetical protein